MWLNPFFWPQTERVQTIAAVSYIREAALFFFFSLSFFKNNSLKSGFFPASCPQCPSSGGCLVQAASTLCREVLQTGNVCKPKAIICWLHRQWKAGTNLQLHCPSQWDCWGAAASQLEELLSVFLKTGWISWLRPQFGRVIFPKMALYLLMLLPFPYGFRRHHPCLSSLTSACHFPWKICVLILPAVCQVCLTL